MKTVCTCQRMHDGNEVLTLRPLPEPPLEPITAIVRRIDSRELLGAASEIEIAHRSQTYRLRRTSLGKLILTK